MKKRKLSKQQKIQITQQQDAALSAGKRGLVVAHYGDQIDLETADKKLIRCNIRQNLPTLVVGDYVFFEAVDATDESGVVTGLEPRHSTMLRRDKQGREKIIAANVDQIFIVLAPEPIRSEQLIDRYLIMTTLQDIPAGLVVNKIDLWTDDALVDKHEELFRFKRLGYPLLYVSTQEVHGFEELKAALKDKTTVFVGLSGVGKSSIIQILLPDTNLDVGALSTQGKQGQHTTTTARLYHLPEGGFVIDSPGVREFALEGLTPTEIERGFIEIYHYAGECKFRDCQHEEEPQCAVLAALDAGQIDPRRFRAFKQTRADGDN